MTTPTTQISAFMGKINAIDTASLFVADAKQTQVINVNLEVVDRPKGFFNCVKVLLSRIVSLLLWDIHSSKRAHNVATAIFAQMDEAVKADQEAAKNDKLTLSLAERKKVDVLLTKLDEKAHFTKNEDLATRVNELKAKITTDEETIANNQKAIDLKANKIKETEEKIQDAEQKLFDAQKEAKNYLFWKSAEQVQAQNKANTYSNIVNGLKQELAELKK